MANKTKLLAENAALRERVLALEAQLNLQTKVDHAQAAMNLLRKYERFSLAAHAAHLGVWDWDVRTDELVWDDMMYPLYGLEREQFSNVYQAWLNCLHPDDLARCQAESQLALQGSQDYYSEFRIRRSDGSVRTIQSTAQIVRDASGTPLRMTGIDIDITEARQSELALAESEARYRGLFLNMEEGLAYCKMVYAGDQPIDFIYLDVNEQFEKLTGLRFTIGKKVSEVIPGIQGANPELFEIYGRVAASGIPEKFEDYVHGLNIWFSISVYSPQSGYFVAVFENITERKLADQALQSALTRLQRLVDANILGIITATADGRILEANDYYLDMLGYSREELQAGKVRWVDMTPPEYLAVDYQVIKELAETGTSRLHTKQYIRKDGSRMWVLIADTVIPGLGEEILSFVLDITAMKTLEADLASQRDQLGLSNQRLASELDEHQRAETTLKAVLEEKESLLREVHHRVKNNLQAMIALMQMQAGQSTETETQHFLKELEGQARAMSLVYEQLYQSENLAHVEMAPYLKLLVDHILESFSAGREIPLKLEVDPIRLDVTQAMPCGLIVNELVTNALKHAFRQDLNRQACLQVGMHLDKDGQTVRLSVADNGAGLPAGLDWRTQRSMGMRLVNLWATHQLGGELQINSQAGTEFTLSFKLTEVMG